MDDFRGKINNLNSEQKALIVILFMFLVRGIIYATVFPLWQAPDEPHHFLNIALLAEKHFPAIATSLSLEQVPQAYVLLFSLYYWFSLIVYLPLAITNVIAIAYALRFSSILLGIIVVFFVYKLSKEITPKNKFVVLGAPLLVSFLPMFTHITSTINSDNLANVTAIIFLWLAIRSIRRGLSTLEMIAMFGVVTLSILIKRTAFFMIPVLLIILPSFLLFRTRSVNPRQLAKRLILVLLIFVGAYLAFPLLNLLSKTLARNPKDFEAIFQLAKEYFKNPAWYASLDRHITIFSMTFWADFGWANVPVANIYYQALEKICLLPLFGLILFLIKSKNSPNKQGSRTLILSCVFLIIAVLSSILMVFTYDVIVVKGLASPQGRYVFTVIGAIAFLFCFGVSQLFKQEYYSYALLIFMAALFFFDATCLFKYIAPFYYKSFSPATIQIKPALTSLTPSILDSTFLLFPAMFFFYLVFLAVLGYMIFANQKDSLRNNKNKTGG